MCTLMLMHAVVQGGCTDTIRETAVKSHPFIICVILYLHYRFLCSIMYLCCCNANVLVFLLRVLKLMSPMFVKLNCPVRDD